MESNKDEALNCVKIASKALHDGDSEKALRFLNKSLKLYPTDEARELLSKISQKSTPSSPKNGSAREPSPTKDTKSPRASSPHKEFTSDQLEIVKKVTKCKNYYEVLEVEKEKFNEADIKKKYRKLALLVHPDKNKAPGANEAFKKVGNAYGVLSDPRKKQEYDAIANRSINDTANGHGHHTQQYNEYTHFETSADITPEELFNVIFGNAFGGGSFGFDNIHRRRRTAYQQRPFQQSSERQDQAQASLLLQMLPILVLVGMSLLSSFLVSDPPYTLLRTGKYQHERLTNKLRVAYYVQDGFIRDYKANIYRIEEQIEQEYIQNLRHNCFRERHNKDSMLWRARHMGNKEMEKKYQDMQIPSCDRLAELHIRVR